MGEMLVGVKNGEEGSRAGGEGGSLTYKTISWKVIIILLIIIQRRYVSYTLREERVI